MGFVSYPVACVIGFAARPVQIRGRGACPAGSGRRGCVIDAAPASASLGTLLDYAAGVIPASEIRAAGAVGSIRYVSDRRPGGKWMLGKPIQVAEARDLHSNGLKIVSCYQYGKGNTADWLGGANAGLQHAQRGMQLHAAAGGPATAPIYASIDDDPPMSSTRARSRRTCGRGSRSSAISAQACTPIRRPSTGHCTTVWALTSGSTTGARPRVCPSRRPLCTRLRSTNAASAGWAWTSTRSSSPNSGSGPSGPTSSSGPTGMRTLRKPSKHSFAHFRVGSVCPPGGRHR